MKKATKLGPAFRSIGRVSLTLVVAITAILTILYSLTDLYSTARKYDQFREDANHAGLYTSVEQTKALFTVDDADNGASILSNLRVPPLNAPKLDTEEHYRLALAAIDPVLRTLERAVAHKRILFNHNDSEPTLFVSREFNSTSWIRLVTGYIRAAVQFDDSANARRLMRIAAALTDHCDEDKTEVAMLMRLSSSQNLEAILRDIVEQHGKDPSWIGICDETLTKLDRPYDLRSALNLQHLADVAFIEHLRQNPLTLHEAMNTRDYPAPVRYSKFLPKFYDASLARIHERYVQTFANLPQDPYDYAGAGAACQSGDEILHRYGFSLTALHTVDIEFTQFVEAIKKESAIRNTVIQAVAMMEAISDPAKEPHVDGRYALDFDGKPIRIKPTDAGDVVYSVWQDGTDDGGKPIVEGRGDWVIHLPK